jgi:hypothetical protein
MSWETLYWVSQLLLVVLAGIALISGAVVNKRQSKQLLTLETNLEEQREKTAKAETSLLELRKQTLEPRRISDEARKKAEAILRTFAKGKAVVSFTESNSLEPRLFASELVELLQSCGWTAELSLAWIRMPMLSGTLIRYGYEKPVGEDKPVLPEHIKSLLAAFEALEPEAGSFSRTEDSEIMKDSPIEIVVGPKN